MLIIFLLLCIFIYVHFDDTHKILSRLSSYVRRILAGESLQYDNLRKSEYDYNLTEKFIGQCGLAQCLGGYALNDLGYSCHPIATQSLQDYWHGHATLSTHFSHKLLDNIYLFDPTFIQFCHNYYDHDFVSPSTILKSSMEGRRILKDIFKKGYLEVTPRTAQIYLSSFCQGKMMPLHEAFSFVSNPPYHPYHFCFEPGDHRFSREALKTNGLLITSNKLTDNILF